MKRPAMEMTTAMEGCAGDGVGGGKGRSGAPELRVYLKQVQAIVACAPTVIGSKIDALQGRARIVAVLERYDTVTVIERDLTALIHATAHHGLRPVSNRLLPSALASRQATSQSRRMKRELGYCQSPAT